MIGAFKSISPRPTARENQFRIPTRPNIAKTLGSLLVSARNTGRRGAVQNEAASSVTHMAPRQSILYGTLGSYAPGWVIQQRLPVNFTPDEDGSFIVSDEIFPVYGTGETPSEAMADYITSLLELYGMVERDVRNRVPDTEDEFARLSYYLAQQQ